MEQELNYCFVAINQNADMLDYTQTATKQLNNSCTAVIHYCTAHNVFIYHRTPTKCSGMWSQDQGLGLKTEKCKSRSWSGTLAFGCPSLMTTKMAVQLNWSSMRMDGVQRNSAQNSTSSGQQTVYQDDVSSLVDLKERFDSQDITN